MAAEAVDTVFDVLVVGAGIIGSATAYHAAKAGARVCLLESRHFLHRTGSSHGESRITRLTYPSTRLTGLMRHCYRLYSDAEKESGTTVYERTGGLDILRRDGATCEKLLAAAAAHDVPVRVLSPAEAAAEYGLVLADTHCAVWQEDTGILRATSAVAMFQSLAARHGAVLRDCTRVTRVVREAEDGGAGAALFTVETSTSVPVRCRRVVLACGPWLAPALESLFGVRIDLQVWQTAVCYWRPAGAPGSAERTAGEATMARLPVVIDYGSDPLWTSTVQHDAAGAPSSGAGAAPVEEDEPCIYGTPCRDFPGMIKFAVHRGPHVTADTRTFEADAAANVEPVQRWLRRVAPFLDASAPAHVETCLYTVSRDEDFILSPLPGQPGVVVAGAGSGHAFKFGALLGAAAAEMALTGACSSWDVSAFDISRPAVGLRPAPPAVASVEPAKP